MGETGAVEKTGWTHFTEGDDVGLWVAKERWEVMVCGDPGCCGFNRQFAIRGGGELGRRCLGMGPGWSPVGVPGVTPTHEGNPSMILR